MDTVQRTRLPLAALLTAKAISQVGNLLTAIAIPWFVLQTTGSATKTGLIAAITTLPPILAGAFAGTLVDRVGFRRSAIAADLASGVTMALVPLLYHTVGLPFWQLCALMFLGAFLDTPGATARQSLIPDLALLAAMPLERANAAAQAIAHAAALVGPALAGVLIAALGTSNVLWLDAVSFAVSALIFAVAVPNIVVAAQTDAAPGGYIGSLVAGLRFLRRRRPVLTLIVVVALLNFAISPVFAVVLPVYADAVFGRPVALGLMYAGFAAGTLVVTVAYGAVGHRLPRRATLLASLLLTALPFGVLALRPGILVAVGALAVAGAVSAPVNPLLSTLLQEQVPAGLRGRVFGLLAAISFAATPAGMLVAGFLLQSVSLRVTLFAEAGLFLAVSLLLPFSGALRAMEKATVVPGEDPRVDHRSTQPR